MAEISSCLIKWKSRLDVKENVVFMCTYIIPDDPIFFLDSWFCRILCKPLMVGYGTEKEREKTFFFCLQNFIHSTTNEKERKRIYLNIWIWNGFSIAWTIRYSF